MGYSTKQKSDWGRFVSPLLIPAVSCYAQRMGVVVEFNEAAFRHDIAREDILHALHSKICDAVIEGLPEKHAVIGFDRA